MIIRPFISKVKQHKMSNIWKLTDNVIQIKDITENVKPDFSPRFNIDGTFTCMRDMELNTTAIYIRPEDVEKFKNIKIIYDKERDFVNITLLKKYVLMKDAYALVANRVVPQAVNIKLIYYCNIMDVNLYIQTTFRLEQDATLYKDLLNFQGLKDKHNLR
jgi:hypothetical protein